MTRIAGTRSKNPPGYPLSGRSVETDDGEFVVTYRPRIRGQRPRVPVPEVIAEALRESHESEVDRRHQIADEEPRRRRKASKRKASKRKAAPKKAAKKAAKKASKRAAAARETAPREPEQTSLFSNPRGAPNLAALGTAAHLGQVMQLLVELPNGEHELHRWSRNRPQLFWSPKQRTLFWVMGRQIQGRQKGAVRSDGAAKTFKRWAQREAQTTAMIKVPAVRLKMEGRAIQIVYHSDKWGERANYEHDFSNPVRAYRNGRKGKVFAVRGGKLTVTERGLVY